MKSKKENQLTQLIKALANTNREDAVQPLANKIATISYELYGNNNCVFDDLVKEYSNLNTAIGKKISKALMTSMIDLLDLENAPYMNLAKQDFLQLAQQNLQNAYKELNEAEEKKSELLDNKLILELLLNSGKVLSLNNQEVEWVEIALKIMELFPIQKSKIKKIFDFMFTTNNLHNAIRANEEEQVKEQIKLATEDMINYVDSTFITPLISALAANFSLEHKKLLVQTLLSKMEQSYIDISDLDGLTAANIALSKGDNELAKMVVEKTSLKALFTINNAGANSLSIAGINKQFDCIKLILEKYNELPQENRASLWDHNNPYHLFQSLIINTCNQSLDLDVTKLAIEDLYFIVPKLPKYANSQDSDFLDTIFLANMLLYPSEQLVNNNNNNHNHDDIKPLGEDSKTQNNDSDIE